MEWPCLFYRRRSWGLWGILLALASTVSVAQPVPDTTQSDAAAAASPVQSVLHTHGADDQSSDRLSEAYAALEENPLDLNQASSSELATLPGLSDGQARRIIQHRAEHGVFSSLPDLEAVKGITAKTVQTIRPFLTVESATEESETSTFPSFRELASEFELDVTQRFSRRLELGRGFREGHFMGPPGRLTTRIHLHSGRRAELGITLDKDPGEPVRWSPATDTYGFDHVAGSVVLRDIGVLESVVLGDFSAQFGQGVAMWQGIRLGKGRDPVGPVLRSGRGLLPYRSASESDYFRGAGATIELPENMYATAFASRQHRDASPDSLSTEETTDEPSVLARTISAGGQHRTSSEIERKGTFGETVFGGAVEYRSPIVTVGATGYLSQFDIPLRPGDRPYRQFRARGDRAYMTSVYATGYVNDYILFGEAARAANGAIGGVAGAAFDRGTDLQAILLGRFYPADFPNFHGNSFGENAQPQNETGFYAGLQLQVARSLQVRAYFDQYRAPWLQYGVPLPSTGSEGRVVLTYTPRPWLSTYVQARAESSEEGTTTPDPGGRVLESVQEETRYSLRLHAEYAFSEALSLRTRVEMAQRSSPVDKATGLFLSQGLRLTPLPSLQIDAQMALFDTDGYAARIYAYERDLRYSFSVPVFFDKGRRSYILAKYNFTPALTVEGKYGITRYAHRSQVGSGLNQIDGPRKREVGFQIRWEF